MGYEHPRTATLQLCKSIDQQNWMSEYLQVLPVLTGSTKTTDPPVSDIISLCGDEA
jgi:hypothetical protein